MVGNEEGGWFGERIGDECCCRRCDDGGLGHTSLDGKNVGGEATILISGVDGIDRESRILFGDVSSLASSV